MQKISDLTISITDISEDQYLATFTFDQPNTQIDKTPKRNTVHFDFESLSHAPTPEEYGEILAKSLFKPKNLDDFYKQCLAASSNQDLRLRIQIDQSAAKLHDLHWETLRNLDSQTFITLNGDAPFSRFLSSDNWKNYTLRSRGQLSALVVIANPKELDAGLQLGNNHLAAINVQDFLKLARESFKGLGRITELTGQGDANQQATLSNLTTCLRQGFDILFLVCHGVLLPVEIDSKETLQPFLILEKSDGSRSYERVNASKIVEYLGNLPAVLRPRLIVLASCQSGGSSHQTGNEQSKHISNALMSFGPRLVQEAGIPAVVAMQDDIQIETANLFFPIFFEELFKYGDQGGYVDRSIAVARNQLKYDGKLPDWWVPVLYLCLKEGRLWYESRFAQQDFEFQGMPGIVKSIRKEKCIPVLGFGFLEFLAGSTREIARRWAQDEGYPLDKDDEDNLPQVAQYLAVRQGLDYPREELLDHIRGRILEEYVDILSKDAKNERLSSLISKIGKWRWEQNDQAPCCILAKLDFPVYITANPDNLLEEALIHQDKDPISRFSRWNKDLQTPEAIQEQEKDAKIVFNSDQPLVYHLFGHQSEPSSLVVTEDDYFEYMMWVNNTSATIPIPEAVLSRWRTHALLFLGFHLDDWSFRVLFRSILNEERRGIRRPFNSYAVQLQPSEDNLSPENARRYLEKYFRWDRLEIFWGSHEDFLNELWMCWAGDGK